LFNFKQLFNFGALFRKMDKKTQIIEKAVELFGSKGYDSTSVRELCDKAGINVAMINYYFGSKEKLFEEMIKYKATYMKSKLEELLSNKEMSSMQKVEKVIEEFVNKIFSNPDFHRIMHRELMLNIRPDLHQAITKVFATNTLTFRSIIEEGIKKKEFKKVDPELTMASIIGTINQVMLSRPLCAILMNKPEDFDPYIDDSFKKRVIRHLNKMMESHLLN